MTTRARVSFQELLSASPVILGEAIDESFIDDDVKAEILK